MISAFCRTEEVAGSISFVRFFAPIENNRVFPIIAPQLSGQITYSPRSWLSCYNGGYNFVGV